MKTFIYNRDDSNDLHLAEVQLVATLAGGKRDYIDPLTQTTISVTWPTVCVIVHPVTGRYLVVDEQALTATTIVEAQPCSN